MMIWAMLGLTLLIAFAWALTPVFAAADPAPDHATERNSTIDGLRGFLALGVVVHHDTLFTVFRRTGEWHLIGGLSTMLGQGGVSLFFMVTGYLFWGRLIRRKGRIGWRRLYIGRVFRIGPLYLVAALAALAVTMAEATGFGESPALLLVQVLRWLALGIPVFEKIAGQDPSFVLVGVTWTLNWEWTFYFSLPVLAIFARARWAHVVLPVTVVAVAAALAVTRVQPDFRPAYVMMFGLGMVTASLQSEGMVLPMGETGRSCLVALLVAVVLTRFDWGYAVGPALLLGAIFYLVATGASLFGLFRSRAAHRLGHISYGIYLLQGLVIHPVFGAVRVDALNSSLVEILLSGAVAALLIPLALLAHRLVEQPGIRLGDRVAEWLGLAKPVPSGVRTR